VGAPLGYSIVDDLKKKGLLIDESPNTLNDFKKLVKGRIAAVAALEMTGDYYLMVNQDLNDKIEKMSPLIVEKPYYFMLSHQFYNENTDLAEKVWDTIAEIRRDPNFQKLLKNYFEQ
jgi:polar amino acid transport system substrate-binding protein